MSLTASMKLSYKFSLLSLADERIFCKHRVTQSLQIFWKLWSAGLVMLLLLSSPSPQAKEALKLPDFTQLVETQGQAVVNISTVQSQQIDAEQFFPKIPDLPEDSPFYDFFRRYMQPYSGPRKYESRSLGSGFIISKDGYILTNAHVVESANEINVKLADKREFKAKVIGADKKTDVALIKIDASSLPTVKQGDPDKLKVGEWVVAIGAPFGFESSVTAGIVSAKGRSLAQENYVPFIQTDVAINPGNSGGPLFNMEGEVVGINSQIYSRTGGFMGLSFAIPIDVATGIARQLREHGKVSRGKIGVMIQEVTEELADSFNLDKPRGALVVSVEKDGPADKAGIKARDVILKFNEQEVIASSDLLRLVGNTKPGSKTSLQVWRNGSTKNLTIKVGEMPGDDAVAVQQEQDKSGKNANRLGLVLKELTNNHKKQLGVESGLLVEEVVEGVARSAGILSGDVILGINDQDIKSVEQFNNLLDKIERGRHVALLVRRGDRTTFISIRVDK